MPSGKGSKIASPVLSAASINSGSFPVLSRLPGTPPLSLTLSGQGIHAMQALTPRTGNNIPYDALRSTNRPLLTIKLNEILTHLVTAYCSQDTSLLPSPDRERIEKNIEILKQAPFEIALTESYSINAHSHPQKRIVYVDLGIFDALIKHPELANWDTIAFVVAHEISHTIYAEQTELAPEEKEKWGAHDMENQCDRDALVMMDKARFNVRYAGFEFFPDRELSPDSTNYGLIQSHPNPYARNSFIKEQVRNSYPEAYANESSARIFSGEEIEEIRILSPFEEAMKRKNGPGAKDITAGLLRCFDALAEYLFIISPGYPFANRDYWLTSSESPDLSRSIPDPGWRENFKLFLAVQSSKGISNETALRGKYAKCFPNDTNQERFESFAWHYFVDEINRASFRADLEDRLAQAVSNIRDRAAKEGDIKWLRDGIERIDRIESATRARDLAELKIAGIVLFLDLPDSTKETLIDIFSEIIGIPRKENSGAKVLIALLRALPALDCLRKNNSKRDLPYESILRRFNKVLSERIFNAISATPQNAQETACFIELLSLSLFNGIPVNNLLGRTKVIYKLEAGLLLPHLHAIVKENNKGLIILLFRLLAPETIAEILKDKIIFSFLLENHLFEALAPFDLGRVMPLERIEEIIFSDKLSSFWFVVLDCAAYRYTTKEADELLHRIPSLLKIIENKLKDPEKDGETRQHLAATIEKLLSKNKTPGEFTIDDYCKIFEIYPAIANTDTLLKYIKNAKIEELMQLLRAINFSLGLSDAFQIKIVVKELASRFGIDLDKQMADILVEPNTRGYYRLKPQILNRARGFSQVILSFDDLLGFNKKSSNDLLVSPDEFKEYQEELSDEMFLLLIKTSRSGPKTFLVSAFIDKLIRENRFNEEALMKLTEASGDQTMLNLKIPENGLPPASEGLGRRISHRDLIYLAYFHRHGFDNLRRLATSELQAWFNKYWPHKSTYRDVVLVKLFRDTFNQLSLDDQQLVISLFHHEERAFKFKVNCYEEHIKNQRSLDDKINLLCSIFPEPSPTRDQYLNEILRSTSFTVTEYGSVINPLFSRKSRQYQRKESIALGTVGAALTQESPKNKMEILLWLLGKGGKPGAITMQENGIGANLDELKELFAASKSFRDEIIENFFAGNKGLFSPDNHESLEKFINAALADHLQIKKGDSGSTIKLKQFAEKALKEFFRLGLMSTKLRIMQALINQLIENRGRLSLEALISAFLGALGVVGVKLAQILASRREIEAGYPELYSRLNELKDNANPMTIEEAMEAIYTNPILVSKNVKIIRPVGSASIKGVFLVEIEGREYILKVRRARAYKDLQEEEASFRELLEALKPELKAVYSVSHLPDYAGRIFSWIKEEIDFEKEKSNSRRLNRAVAGHSSKNISVAVPCVVMELSNHNTIIENAAPGVSLKEAEQDPAKAELISTVKSLIQRIFLAQIFREGFFHADPHGGNIFIHQAGDKKLVNFIDTGLCAEIDEATREFLKRITHPLKRDILTALKTFLPPEVFAINQAMIVKEVSAIEKLAPQRQGLALLALFDKLKNYETPDVLVRVFTGISKAPFLFEMFAENRDEYLKVWSFTLVEKARAFLAEGKSRLFKKK